MKNKPREIFPESHEKDRYLRQVIIPGFGLESQIKLKTSSVLIIGCGGLGSPAAIYLAAAGVGKIGLADYDVVNISNLHRQILFNDGDEGLAKSEIAGSRIQSLNPNVETISHNIRLDSENIAEIIGSYDVVVDGSDNFATRYLVNDVCVRAGKPFISGSVLRYEAQVSFFNLPGGPCYRCLFPEQGISPDCSEAGVLGVVPGIAGTIMAAEAIKYLTGIGKLLKGRLLVIDVFNQKFKEIVFGKNKLCHVCFPDSAGVYTANHNISNNSNSQIKMTVKQITVEDLKEKMDSGEKFFLLDVREMHEIPIASIGGRVIPLSELMDRLNELPENKDEEIIVYCRTGNRSHHAVKYLTEELGYTNAKNLVGGIHAWSDRIDPSVKKY